MGRGDDGVWERGWTVERERDGQENRYGGRKVIKVWGSWRSFGDGLGGLVEFSFLFFV